MLRIWLILVVAVAAALLVFSYETSNPKKLHIHRDVISFGNLHRESLPIADLKVALGNKAITPRQTRLAIKLALGRWGKTHCSGRIQILKAHLLPLNIIAQAQWYTGARSRVYLDCSVTYNSSRANLTFPFYCATMTHEYGHLSGFHQAGGLDGGTHSK